MAKQQQWSPQSHDANRQFVRQSWEDVFEINFRPNSFIAVVLKSGSKLTCSLKQILLNINKVYTSFHQWRKYFKSRSLSLFILYFINRGPKLYILTQTNWQLKMIYSEKQFSLPIAAVAQPELPVQWCPSSSSSSSVSSNALPEAEGAETSAVCYPVRCRGDWVTCLGYRSSLHMILRYL